MSKPKKTKVTPEQMERLHALVVKHLLASFEKGKPTIQDMAGATAILKKAGLASNDVGRPRTPAAVAPEGLHRRPGGPVLDNPEDGGPRRPMLLDPGIKLPFPVE